jgi:hypothetical protein
MRKSGFRFSSSRSKDIAIERISGQPRLFHLDQPMRTARPARREPEQGSCQSVTA